MIIPMKGWVEGKKKTEIKPNQKERMKFAMSERKETKINVYIYQN